MAKEIYSLDEEKMVTIPEDAPKDEESETNDKEDESDDVEEEDEAETETEEAEPETEDSDETTEDEESEEDGDEEESETVTTDDFIKDKFGEEYGITSEEDFKDVLDRSVELLEKNETLEAEIKKLKEAPSAPVFKSKTQESVYNALKDYDPEKIPDGLHMMAGLIGMDLDKTDPKLILEQQFIMEHPELGLERARKKFQRRFDEKFVVNEETFDGTPEQLKEKKEDLDSDLQIETAKAKKFIKEKQAEFKVKSENKEEVPEVNEAVQTSIASNTDVFNKHMDGLTELIFQADESDDKNLFHYKFSKEDLKKINVAMIGHLSKPSDYDAKGNLIGGFDPEEKFQVAAFAICGKKITAEALKFAQNLAQTIKADDIGKKKPIRKAKASGDSQSMDIDAQAERLAKKKAAERQNKGN